ncbi:MAG: hypothetical protein NTZ33_05765 [Bacteroidetes bacterium]|nr:hypothetical protein [Bacteroidota bacterium]
MFKDYYQSKVIERIAELKDELILAKNKRLKFNDNDAELTYIQRCKKRANEIDNEIKLLIKKGDYTEFPFKNIVIKFGLIYGKLYYDDILAIEKAINEAEKLIIIEEAEELKDKEETQNQERNNKLASENESNSKWTTPVFALFLYFLKNGGYKKSITKKYLEELCKEFSYSKDIENLNNTIITIKKGNEKDPFNEINLLYIITLFAKDYINYPKSKSLAINALTDYQPKPMK